MGRVEGRLTFEVFVRFSPLPGIVVLLCPKITGPAPDNRLRLTFSVLPFRLASSVVEGRADAIACIGLQVERHNGAELRKSAIERSGYQLEQQIKPKIERSPPPRSGDVLTADWGIAWIGVKLSLCHLH